MLAGHYVTLHSSRLGQLTETSFSMNIHNTSIASQMLITLRYSLMRKIHFSYSVTKTRQQLIPSLDLQRTIWSDIRKTKIER